MFGEIALYTLSRFFLNTSIAETSEHREARMDRVAYEKWRARQTEKILTAMEDLGVVVNEQSVLDFGCAKGAITEGYKNAGATQVFGVDVNEANISEAKSLISSANVHFEACTDDHIPLADESVDVAIAHDVFEHVSHPDKALRELHRVLNPGGKLVIGTWGWGHPYAPHLWHKVPVPWSHILLSEKTIMRVVRRVYRSQWYTPRPFEMDDSGNLRDLYQTKEIDSSYLNKFYIRDFERTFAESPFLSFEMKLVPFGSRWARWSRVFLKNSLLREYCAAFFWCLLQK